MFFDLTMMFLSMPKMFPLLSNLIAGIKAVKSCNNDEVRIPENPILPKSYEKTGK